MLQLIVWSVSCVVAALLVFPQPYNGIGVSAEEFFHRRPDQHKSHPGWQEPGLWRPKWVMDREFHAVEGNQKSRDRIYFKMTSDRTIRIYRNSQRPLLQLGKVSRARKQSKQLFESGTEKLPDTQSELEQYQAQQEELWNSDGTWTFADETPKPSAKVRIETREGPGRERIRHEARCEWGRLDGYAARFRRGYVYKYKGTKAGSSDVPIGKYVAGTFVMRANAHRPLVSKDFQAFQ